MFVWLDLILVRWSIGHCRDVSGVCHSLGGMVADNLELDLLADLRSILLTVMLFCAMWPVGQILLFWAKT